MSFLPRGIWQPKKLPANEPLAFTVCKLELLGVIVLQKESKFVQQNKKNWGAIAKVWLQGGTLDGHEI